jgi:prevent-host-death family protein
MTQTINIHEAKTRLSQLLQQVEEGDEIIISRANKPIARLVAYHEKVSQRHLGEAKGMVKSCQILMYFPKILLRILSENPAGYLRVLVVGYR